MPILPVPGTSLFPHRDAEPWVDLPNGAELSQWGKEQEVAYNQAIRQSEKLRLYALSMDYLKENGIEGDYLEFGCHRARTFRMALTEARRRNMDHMRFLAFDSFEGLPQVGSDHGVSNWQPGALATSEAEFLRLIGEHGIYADKVRTIKGFYDASLTAELGVSLAADGVTVAMVNIDCDFYESALPVFAFIEPLLTEGSVIYIDDFFAGYRGSPDRGVAKAFKEFCARSRFRFIEHLQVGWSGRSFIAYIPQD